MPAGTLAAEQGVKVILLEVLSLYTPWPATLKTEALVPVVAPVQVGGVSVLRQSLIT
ncbi:unannotated protein [freshwater metagenome]|uniref:Unannotated protein n=1 Tax=freshwater metagenome TaxID=449393 RepID=A0A6J7QQP1_9ZZZZ